MPKKRCRPKWKSSFSLNRIRRDADDLRSRISTLPLFLSARTLARFLGVSKTPVLQWIRRGNLAITRRGKRLAVERSQVDALIAAACRVPRYTPPLRKPFQKLQRQRRRLKNLSQKEYSVGQLAQHFGCSTSTILRAIRSGCLNAYRKTPGRWRVKRPEILRSRAFSDPRHWRIRTLIFSENSS